MQTTNNSNTKITDKFFIREYGLEKNKAPTLVFIHGLLGWGLNWSPIIKYFESEFHIITYDQRGHGRSFHPESGYAPENYAQDLKDILDDFGLKTVHLVGHSMGARTAQCFAAQYPGRTISLTIEDMGPNPEGESTLTTQQMIMSVPVPFKSKAEMDAFFESKFKVKTSSDDTQTSVMANFLKANLTRKSEDLSANLSGSLSESLSVGSSVGSSVDSGVASSVKSTMPSQIDWRFSLTGILETLDQGLKPRWSEFKCIEVPTLLIRGENSKHLSPETFELMKDSLPGIQTQVIPNVGHWVHYQAPELFSQYVLKFLRELS